MKKATRQTLRLHLLFVWGLSSILVCGGDDLPGLPMSDAMFYGTKIAGTASLWLCCYAGRWLNKKGLLPEIKEEDRL